MKYILWAFACLSLMGLAGCDFDNHEQHEASEQYDRMSHTMRMHHLHMLINHALQMSTQGGDMLLLGSSKHGLAMLDKAEKLLHRAMSGPEMAAMYKQGQAKTVAMKMTHDLADSTSELINQMRNLSKQAENRDSLQMLHHAVEVAATGSSLIMLGQQGMAGDIDLVMVNHGQTMLGEASGLLYEEVDTDAYSMLVRKIVQMLIGIPEHPAGSVAQ
jgi:hypothetical protein